VNITKVSFNQKFNLGNYESIDVGAEAQLSDKDNPLEVWTILRDNAEMWFISEKNKKPTPHLEQPLPLPQTSTPKTQQLTNKNTDPITTLRANFTEEIDQKLNYKQQNSSILIHPKNFLGSEIFAEISTIVRRLRGEYISAGRDSHWRIPT
jgi:hypothetical protein